MNPFTKREKIAGITGVVLIGGIVLAACSSTTTNSAIANGAKQSNQQLNIYEKNQPVPLGNFSEYRQTLIDIEDAQIHGVATTTFFYNMGSNVPIKSCPSIGYPVASTSQLTNPDQALWNYSGSDGVSSAIVSQLEPNGVYTGDSTGTYVVCVNPNGDQEIDYWEGFVETQGGPATIKSGKIVADGQSTAVLDRKKHRNG